MINAMVRGNSFIKKEATMMENGKKIKCMDLAFYTTPLELLPTKESGKKINLMVKAPSIMTSNDKSMEPSTSRTSIS